MRNRTFIIVALLAGGAWAGCDEDEDQARLRVVHAAVGAPAVDVYIEGRQEPLFRDVTFGETTSTDTIAPGRYILALRPTGASPTSAPIARTEALDLAAGLRVDAVAAGDPAATDEANRLRIIIVANQQLTVPSGQTRVRVVHAVPGVGDVGIDVGADGSAEITSLDRFTVSDAILLRSEDTNRTQVAMRPEGGTQSIGFTLPALPEGEDLTLIALGRPDAPPRVDDGLSLLPVAEDTLDRVRQNPVIYALHAVPDAPPVDLFIGPNQVAGDLAFRALTPRLQVAPGEYTLDVFPAAADTNRPAGAPIASLTQRFEAGAQYMVTAAGQLMAADPSRAVRLIPLEDSFDTGGSRVRVLHAVPDAPAVDVGLLDDTGQLAPNPVITDLEFAEATDDAGIQLPAGEQRFGLAPTGSRTPVATFTVTVSTNARLFTVATGTVTGAQPLSVLRIDTAALQWSAVPAGAVAR